MIKYTCFILLPESRSICISFCLRYNFYHLMLVTRSANIYYLIMISTEHDSTNLVGGDPPCPQITTFSPFDLFLSYQQATAPVTYFRFLNRSHFKSNNLMQAYFRLLSRPRYLRQPTLLVTSTCSSFLDRQSVI